MPIRILVVDDEANIREMARLMLEKRGYSVMTAENGVTALQAVKKDRPDLILLDVLMPEMDGYTFYKELKKNHVFQDLPVLIITARGMMEDSFKVMGVDGFLAKPVLPQDLLSQIEHILEIHAIRQDTITGQTKPLTRRILLIGTRALTLEQMAFEAKRLDFDSEIAVTGSDAIGRAVKFFPGMIFIDVQMRDMSTVEIVQTLRRLPQFEETPIIGYCYYDTTSLGDEKIRQQVLRIEDASRQLLHNGATHYLGRYNHRLFIQTIRDFAFRKKSA